jgi:hypothetical protein
MRIYSSPVVILVNKKPHPAGGTGKLQRERFRICEVPQQRALLPQDRLAGAITPDQISFAVSPARLLRGDGGTAATEPTLAAFNRGRRVWLKFRSSSTGSAAT